MKEKKDNKKVNSNKNVDMKKTKKVLKKNNEDNFLILQFLKLFDMHFLNFISLRKIRDLLLYNEFINQIISLSTINKKDILKLELTDFFNVKKNKLEITKQLPINKIENIIQLEQELSILKTFEEFFKKILNDNKQYDKIASKYDIKAKIMKISKLNDELFLSFFTKNNTIKKEIINEIGKIKKYEDIFINNTFYSNLLKEYELFSQKI